MKKNNKGFTLVELLAVIVVLAVIMVIAGTSIIGIINKNNADAFVSTARIAHETLKQCKTLGYTDAVCLKMVDYDTSQYELSFNVSGGTYTLKGKGKFAKVHANLVTYYGISGTYDTEAYCKGITDAGGVGKISSCKKSGNTAILIGS